MCWRFVAPISIHHNTFDSAVAQAPRSLTREPHRGTIDRIFGCPRLHRAEAGAADIGHPACRCRLVVARRRMAAMPPVSAARSVSARMRSLSWAVKILRCRRAVSSDDDEAGAATVGFRLPFVADASASIGVCIMSMSKIILQHPQRYTPGETMSHCHWHLMAGSHRRT